MEWTLLYKWVVMGGGEEANRSALLHSGEAQHKDNSEKGRRLETQRKRRNDDEGELRRRCGRRSALAGRGLFESINERLDHQIDGHFVDVLYVLRVAVAQRHLDGLQERIADFLSTKKRERVFLLHFLIDILIVALRQSVLIRQHDTTSID